MGPPQKAVVFSYAQKQGGEQMKAVKTALTAIGIAAAILAVEYAPIPHVYYERECHIYACDQGVMVLEDEDGNLWRYETYSDLYEQCTIVLDNMSTPEIHDDVIVYITAR